MKFEHLLLEFISSTIWTATIDKHWSLSSARHQLFLSVFKWLRTQFLTFEHLEITNEN